MSLLENLQTFLRDFDDIVPLELITDKCEFEHVNIQQIRDLWNKNDDYDDQITTYVAGFLVRKLKALECKECAANLITDTIAPYHTYTTFKEHSDNRNRLTYVTSNISNCLKQIYDIIMFLLPNYINVLHISKKFNLFIKHHVNFQWFTCKDHLDMIVSSLCPFS